MTKTFKPEEAAFAAELREHASIALADWSLRQFDAGHSLDDVKSAIRRAMAVVESERPPAA